MYRSCGKRAVLVVAALFFALGCSCGPDPEVTDGGGRDAAVADAMGLEHCADGIDNDSDSHTDCADSDCRRSPFCLRSHEYRCADGIDEDDDGVTDCDDSDCFGEDACFGLHEVFCEDRRDNDGDSLIDCDDPDCDGDGHCAEWSCQDGRDNDGDGLEDCADPDCIGDFRCPSREVCDNHRNDDDDELPDCADPDCSSHPACTGSCPEVDQHLGEALGEDIVRDFIRPDEEPRYTLSCQPSRTPPERVYGWRAPRDGEYFVALRDVESDRDVRASVEVRVGCVGEVRTCGAADREITRRDVPFTATAGEELVILVETRSSLIDYAMSIYEVLPEDCDNGIDDDRDGDVDCVQASCAVTEACAEVCSDGVDNTADGRID